uniref:PLOD1-3-like GT domain-containing protein n=1 Tax=viral metagenome TaxID=1070528 RepID=A0A6C0DS10_9ZZZZ
MNTQLHYITVATKPHAILDKLIKTVNNKNETITVLSQEEDRWIGWQSNGNFGIKLKAVYDFLQRKELNDYDIVLFTDAYDVVYFGNRQEVIRRYEELDMPIIFGAEKLCNPDPWREREYSRLNPNLKTLEFPFLNSGMFIGRVWALKLSMLCYKYEDSHDDQRFWTTQYLEHPSLIKLDHNNKLFLNTADIDIGCVEYNPIVNTVVYNSNFTPAKIAHPLFVHVNGPIKDDLHLFL